MVEINTHMLNMRKFTWEVKKCVQITSGRKNSEARLQKEYKKEGEFKEHCFSFKSLYFFKKW